MSPTFLELTVGLIAAVLAFLWAVRVVPLAIAWLTAYLNESDETDERTEDYYDR